MNIRYFVICAATLRLPHDAEVNAPYLPPHRIKFRDALSHVFMNIVGVNDGVDFESHSVLSAPVPHFAQVVYVAFFALGSTDCLVGFLIKAVTGDC